MPGISAEARKVNTVLGPVAPEDLGITLVHEHIAAAYPGWDCDPLSRPYDREKIVDVCLRNLEPVKSYGVRSVVDATPADLGRDVEIMKSVSDRLEINIVCSTGRYSEEEGNWAYLKQRSRSGAADMTSELYESLMFEITSGIGESHVKPGVIKVATGLDRISECEEALMAAAAQASGETGLPIITHTQDGTMGPQQAEFLIGEGVDPGLIMVGHMCGNSSLVYQQEVLGTGVSISFDRFGLQKFMPDEVRVSTLVELLGMGYTDRILMSQDFIGCTFGRKTTWPDKVIRQNMNWSYTNIFRRIIPALEDAGVTERQVDTMMVENPRRLLSGR